MNFIFPRMQQGKKQVNIVFGDLMWIRHRKERLRTQRKSKLVPHADGPVRVLKKDGVGVDESTDLRANLFQQRGLMCHIMGDQIP